ncbi:MAG TPA: TonB-dependent receptor [Vicinamibacterales bacterium]|nr:TonB-dependent receptor [Vicinamibacterales bacterium]
MRRYLFGAAIVLLLTCASVLAQQTTGTVTGRVVDQQGSAVPGATVTAKSSTTGFTRSEVSDAEGVYRLSALPVGIYDVTAELQGFTTVSKQGVEVNVAQIQNVDFPLKVAQLAETVNVTGATPLIKTTASSVGAVVDVKRIESIPLNGRQFANLAATVPGVGLSFHTDPTKSTQYAPLVNGGSGRNINYQIDGGDNNDDTVGGQLEAFPLEAIEQFNFQTQRFKAEYGRSNGGVLSVVTKSGTNLWSGSAFEFFRDKSMNALTETEILAAPAGSSPVKGDYRQNQFGGSFGGPILKDQAHFFVAVERTNQDKTQAVNTQGLFPDQDGVFAVPYRETPFSGKVTANLNANQFLSVRYGRDTNSQPYNAAPNSTYNNWGDSANKYNSFNLNHNWVMSGSKLNEFIFQYADFGNTIASRSNKPNESFPNGVTTGANGNTPQTTEQTKYQFRDDFSWHASGGGGLGHDFKVGANFINEPHLFITFNTGKGVTFNTHITNDVNGPISLVTVSDGNAGANIPMKQFATYFQDDWRVTDRLTLNFGVRYDYMTGYQIDESKNPNFVAVQAAGAAGKLAGIVGLENFGLTPQEDRNNVQPRLGAVYDLRGNGKDIVRGGWGVYTDVGYTNSNVLFAATDSTGEGFGQIFNVNVTNGIKNPDGSFYRAGQPLSNIASQNQVTSTGAFPLTGQWIDPRLQQPYQMQSNLGWSHELTSDTVFAVDYVNSLGRDLNLRPRVNQRIPGSLSNPRRLAAIIPTLTPNTNGNRPTVSRGKSEYNAMVLSVRRRMSHGFDFQANYTLQKGVSTVGTAADALNTANIQDPNNPFDDPRQLGPMADVDSRHLINISASFQLPYGIRLAPIFFFRSALPVSLVDGRDINLDGDATEIPTTAYAVDSFDASKPQLQQVTVKSIGTCETVNCGRGYYQTQTNLRLSKVFNLGGRAHVEAIGEIFNLFNNINPSGFRTRVIVPATGVADPNLLQPATYSGDFRRPEQRVGQLGLRFTF